MTNDSENWELLQALFHLAEGVPEERLDELLLNASPDAELRSRARALILAARADPAAEEPAGTPEFNARIGPYTVLRHLGSGGIGAVYLVERLAGGTVQRSAVKVLSLHAAGPAFVERFEREQHILASLDHPNITRMLDAGVTESGEPYLVMEYVDGLHLDVYCDDRSLGIPERLQLFLKVCEAVAYAHRNLIVHLDLKPSNILATEAGGTIKLLDFGTSKLIQPDSLLTTTVMATPAYASPEQLRNEAVTTACDIYSLGAILFELLAGRRPNLDSSVAIMIERSLKELPPEPVTAAVSAPAAEHRGLTETRLRSLLSGDLATIVAKCLSPRPKDRYTSVDALITDVQRYLAGRPILARPQTTGYKISKFVRRNRKAVIAGTLAVIALIGSLGYAAWRQQQAVIAGQRALQMQTFMYGVFRVANSNYLGKPTATVPEFLMLGLRMIPDFIQNPADRRAARVSLTESLFEASDMANAQQQFGSIVADAKAAGDVGVEAEAEGYASICAFYLGQTDLSLKESADALALIHQPGVTPAQRVRVEVFYAIERENLGRRSEENVNLLKSALQESQEQHLPARETAWVMKQLGNVLGQRGDGPRGEALGMEALAIYKSEPYTFCEQADTETLLAHTHSMRNDMPGALDFYHQANDGFNTCFGPDNQSAMATQVYVAQISNALGKPQDAIKALVPALPMWRKITHSGPGMASVLSILSTSYYLTRQFPQAAASAQEAVEVQQGKVNPNSSAMGFCQLQYAQALAGEKDPGALQQARLAQQEYAGIPAPTASDQHHRAEADKLVLDLQAGAAGTAIPAPQK